MLGWVAVEGLDWSRLLHAYGPATDTPKHLRDLTGDDPAKQAAALDHLYGSVNHQYSCYPATSSAVRVVGGLLEDRSLRRAIAEGRELVLAGVLDFFDSVAYGAAMAAEGGAHLLDDEVPPRVVESDAPHRVVWSSLWPSRPGDQVVLELADAGSETALTFTLLADGDMPDESKTGASGAGSTTCCLRIFGSHMANSRIRAAVVGNGPRVDTGVESQHVAERIGVLRGGDVVAS